MKKYIISLDQGTTSSRAILFNLKGEIVGVEQREFSQYFPKSGWVEHDPDEIWSSQYKVLLDLIENQGVGLDEVLTIGITNQRETTILWDKATGKPVHNAIVWQDKRNSAICEELKKMGLTDQVRKTTGLVIDAYFSGTKIKWILDQNPELRTKAQNGDILFGTVDSWLIWKLTNGRNHATDVTNASRTMIFDIHNVIWDKELLKTLNIPSQMLPEVKPCDAHFGVWSHGGVEVPITGVAGDQQAALIGQTCFTEGTAKNTYGTGCFMLMNTGETPKISENGLLTTIAYQLGGKLTYALEGSVFIAGAAIQWLRDGLNLISNAAETERMVEEVASANDVVVVPAFAGLGAPYWDMYARGAIFGLTRDTDQRHIVKATLDSLAYQTKDILDAMESDSGIQLKSLKVDGGAVANDYLMQFQADILAVAVERPQVIESTALGAAYVAGIGIGHWSIDDLRDIQRIDKAFEPKLEDETRNLLYAQWQKAVKRSMNWIDE